MAGEVTNAIIRTGTIAIKGSQIRIKFKNPAEHLALPHIPNPTIAKTNQNISYVRMPPTIAPVTY